MLEGEVKALAFIKASKNRFNIIKLLNDSKTPLTPSEVAQRTKLSLANISRSLNQLKNFNFVNCIKEGRIKLYFLTDKSKKVLKFLEIPK